MAVLTKLNTNDFTPEPGITPDLAATYAKWLVELGIDGIEVSSGTVSYSTLAMSRKKDEKGEFALREAYHLEAAQEIKHWLADLPLFLVGGLRKKSKMEALLKKGEVDMISMCRPFIHEPHLVKRFAEGKSDTAGCVSCNNCLLAVRQGLPVKCYIKGLPNS